jgi:hypothetical protein
MPLTTQEHVAEHIEEVTAEQVGKVHEIIGPDGKTIYAAENERGDCDPEGSIMEYCVRYSEERGFSCTCPSGNIAFANVTHLSGVCKHCRWTVAFMIEKRAALAAIEREEERRRQVESATALLSPSMIQFPSFWAMRPSWFDTNEEREAFQIVYPALVEKYADCWKEPAETETEQGEE